VHELLLLLVLLLLPRHFISLRSVPNKVSVITHVCCPIFEDVTLLSLFRHVPGLDALKFQPVRVCITWDCSGTFSHSGVYRYYLCSVGCWHQSRLPYEKPCEPHSTALWITLTV
jgi:hypothetical protein